MIMTQFFDHTSWFLGCAKRGIPSCACATWHLVVPRPSRSSSWTSTRSTEGEASAERWWD